MMFFRSSTLKADRKVVFAIPLKPARMALNWSNVERNLRATIKSILNSTSSQFLIVIAGHDEPDLAEVKDKRLVFLRVPFDPQVYPNIEKLHIRANLDKNLKRAHAGAWIRSKCSTRCHVVFLDADDLIHREWASFILNDQESGCVASAGYRFDTRKQNLQRIDREFWKRCGSGFAGVFTHEDLPRRWDDKESVYCDYRGHQKYVDIAKQNGMSVRVTPFPAVVYMVNHTESLLFAKKGVRDISTENIIDRGLAGKILQRDFSLELPTIHDVS
jgi:hypothetical protein